MTGENEAASRSPSPQSHRRCAFLWKESSGFGWIQLVFTFITLLCASSPAFAYHLETVYQWNLLRFNTPAWYPSKEAYKANATFIRGIEITSDRIFLAVPELRADCPASLVYVPRYTTEKDPPFEAYPNWNWHVGGLAGIPFTNYTCDGLISVHRIRLDQCGRLWVLDSGIGFLSADRPKENICPPKLVAFDLLTNQEVRRIPIHAGVLRRNSWLTNFVIDYSDEDGKPSDQCDVGYVYVCDFQAPGLIVVDLQTTEMWRHFNPNFYPDPQHSVMRVANKTIANMIGITGLALGPATENHRELFFSAFASRSVYSVPTAALKNRPHKEETLHTLPVKKMWEKPSQSLSICYDATDNALLFGPMTETALMSHKFGEDRARILSQDPVALQWISDIRVDDDDNIWVVSSRMQNIFFGTVNPHEVNQRVMRLNRYTPFNTFYSKFPQFK